MTDTYDVVVIGGGPVGENVAERAVRGGLTAVLVEAELYGGECSYWACMPSKALLRPGHALAAARRLPGVPVRGELDAAKVLARRDEFTSHWDDDGQVRWAHDAGIDTVRGRGRITGERQVTVDGERVLTARQAVVVCTGSVPRTPDLPGLSEVSTWTSRDATSAKQVPGRLAVLGGGVVGVEMAQAWRRLGSQVTLVVSQQRPLERFESFVGDLVADGLRADGVDLRLGAKAESAANVDGDVELRLAGGDPVRADHLLVATGRRPATGNLGVEAFGLSADRPLTVDDTGLVSGVDGRWLYAAGDVTGRAPLTHQGKYAGRVVGDVIAARSRGEAADPAPWSAYTSTADNAAVPQVVFTDPEVASVGLTSAQAGDRARAVGVDIAVAGSSLHGDGYTGRASIVVDRSSGVLLGATFVGPDVAELLHAATVAVVGEVPVDRLWHAVPAYPTISEVWLNLLRAYGL